MELKVKSSLVLLYLIQSMFQFWLLCVSWFQLTTDVPIFPKGEQSGGAFMGGFRLRMFYSFREDFIGNYITCGFAFCNFSVAGLCLIWEESFAQTPCFLLPNHTPQGSEEHKWNKNTSDLTVLIFISVTRVLLLLLCVQLDLA